MDRIDRSLEVHPGDRPMSAAKRLVQREGGQLRAGRLGSDGMCQTLAAALAGAIRARPKRNEYQHIATTAV
jgi:hypothetical protein